LEISIIIRIVKHKQYCIHAGALEINSTIKYLTKRNGSGTHHIPIQSACLAYTEGGWILENHRIIVSLNR
jgi:hypothetical protein